LVLGAASVAAPEGVRVPAAAIFFDIPVMIAVAVASLPIFFTGHLISRFEGVLFLAYYGAYIAYLFLNAGDHGALLLFNHVMIVFVVPLTVLTLGIGVWRQLNRRP
jgi:cation:H+ antiporter